MNIFRTALKAAALALVVTLAVPSVYADDTDTKVTVTKTKHKYVYYGDHDIYFAPESKTYYWQSNGTWTSGTTLPEEYTGYVKNGGVNIELDVDKPYERHDYVIAHYKHKHHDDD